MLVVALQAHCHSQNFTVAAHVSERIIVRVTAVSLVVSDRPPPITTCFCVNDPPLTNHYYCYSLMIMLLNLFAFTFDFFQ